MVEGREMVLMRLSVNRDGIEVLCGDELDVSEVVVEAEGGLSLGEGIGELVRNPGIQQDVYVLNSPNRSIGCQLSCL